MPHVKLFNRAVTILALAAVAVFAVLLATPARAQTDAVWSATLTVKDLGNSVYGCDNDVPGKECSSTPVLSDDDFELGYPATTYTVTEITLSNGGLGVFFDKDVNTALSGLSLRVGSTWLAFPDSDEGYFLGNKLPYWVTSGLSWSDGDTVSLSIVVTGAITDLAVAPAATTAVVTWKNITPYQEGGRRWRGHRLSWKPADRDGPITYGFVNWAIKGGPEDGVAVEITIRNLRPGATYDLTVSDRDAITYDPASSGGEATVRFTTATTETVEPKPFEFIVLIHKKNNQGESKEKRRLKVDRPFDADTMAYTAKVPPRFTHAAIAHNSDLYDVTLTSNQDVEVDRTHVPLKKGINVITAAVTPRGSEESQTYTFTILRPANGNGNTSVEAPRNVTSTVQDNGDLLITWDDPANAEADDVNISAWLVQWRPKGVEGNNWSNEPFILVHPKGDDNRITVAKEIRIASSDPDVEFQARVRAYDAEAKRLGPGASSPR